MQIILWLLIGAIAGWIAGKLMRGDGFGLVGNLVVGIIGGIVGGALLGLAGLTSNGGLVGSLVTAVFGAVVLLWLVSFFRERLG